MAGRVHQLPEPPPRLEAAGGMAGCVRAGSADEGAIAAEGAATDVTDAADSTLPCVTVGSDPSDMLGIMPNPIGECYW